jgi:eukaryotic-like serine/threonine-protein kinase
MLAERYELDDVLGEGGMGRVLLAHDRVLQRDVAVKLLTSTADAAARARFLREAQGAARLRHPNAVTVFDTGEADGQPYIVMELVRGITLDELIERDGPLEVQEATAITAGVLEALAAAHAAGLVHRDVKPGNVLLPHEGGVKLTDFGIARAMDQVTSSLTVAGTVLGTPSYLAPELLDGAPASPASDLYSVGCMLYVQLAGEPPFTAETPLAVAYAHQNRDIPRIEQVRADVPVDLRRVLTTALAKDPADRYADAAAMRDALLDGPATGPSRESTLPLTAAIAPDPDATAVLSDAGAPAGGAAAAGAAAGGGPVSGAGASSAAAADPTVALHDEPGTPARRTRSPWVAFALGAVVLLAFVALVLAFQGGDGTGDEETDDEPTDEQDPEPTTDDDPPDDSGEPTTDEPEAPAPDPEPDVPEEPAPTPPDDPTPDEPAPSEPEEPAPTEPEDPGTGGGGPDGDGPPGQDVPPGQAD